MGLFDLFKKKAGSSEPTQDPVSGLTLSSLKKGDYLDYDMKTWQVKAANTYDWGRGDITREWQLESHDDIIFLEMEMDDTPFWSISRKIPLSRLNQRTRSRLTSGEDPPDTLTFEDTLFYLDETGGGHFHADGTNTGRELFQWTYTDDNETRYLTIEQWGEREFELCLGHPVKEYQFTDILPGGASQS